MILIGRMDNNQFYQWLPISKRLSYLIIYQLNI